MKLPTTNTSSIGTLGMTGVTLLVLSTTGFINELWLMAAIFFILAGIGSESK